jgi:hypothetical protein
VYPNELGLGTVVVRFVRDLDVGSIFPDAGEVAAVQAKLDAERPDHGEPQRSRRRTSRSRSRSTSFPTTPTRARRSPPSSPTCSSAWRAGDGAGRGTVLLSQIARRSASPRA